jgi:hypothetical protein
VIGLTDRDDPRRQPAVVPCREQVDRVGHGGLGRIGRDVEDDGRRDDSGPDRLVAHDPRLVEAVGSPPDITRTDTRPLRYRSTPVRIRSASNGEGEPLA